jgi:hypothetical protein
MAKVIFDGLTDKQAKLLLNGLKDKGNKIVQNGLLIVTLNHHLLMSTEKVVISQGKRMVI